MTERDADLAPRTASLPASITVCYPECGMRAQRVGACASRATEAPPIRPSSRPSVGSVRLYERTLQLSQNRVFSMKTLQKKWPRLAPAAGRLTSLQIAKK